MKLCIIGRIAEHTNLSDGQAIKTKILRDELIRCFPFCSVQYVETTYAKKHLFRIFFQTIAAWVNCDCIFVLLSENGRKFFFPLLYYLNKIKKIPIYHVAIGGRLLEEVESKRNWKKYICSFSVNWIELTSLQRKLVEAGVANAETLPNFKRLDIVPEEEMNTQIPEIFRFCTFSRVTKDKGIASAVNAVKWVNKQAGKVIAYLDIFGEIDPAYKVEFDNLLANSGEIITYCGVVPYDKSVTILKNYYMLLFPSTHVGEGFPGTFIDAFSAGLPILASDWAYNAEIIRDDVTGWCYPVGNEEYFYTLMQNAVTNPSKVLAMKMNCVREAKRYHPDRVIDVICKKIETDIS